MSVVYLLIEMEGQWVALSAFVVLLSLNFFSQGGFHVFIGTDQTGSLDVHCGRMVDTAHKQCQKLIEQYQDIINAKEDSCLSSLERARTDDWACARSFNRSMQFQDATCRIAMKSWEGLHGIRNSAELDLDVGCGSECKKELSECMKTLQTQFLACNNTLHDLHLQKFGRDFRRLVVIRNLHLQLNRTHSDLNSVQEELERCSSRLLEQSWSSVQLTAFGLVVSLVIIALLWKYWIHFVPTTPSDRPPGEVLGAQTAMGGVQIQGQRGLTDFTALERSVSELEHSLQVKESQLQQLGELKDTEMMRASSEVLQSQHRIQELNDIIRDSEQKNSLLQQEVITTRQQLQSMKQQVDEHWEDQQLKEEEVRKLTWKLERLQANQAQEKEEEVKQKNLLEEKTQQLKEHCQQITREQHAELVQQERQYFQEKAEKDHLLVEMHYKMSEMELECSRKEQALERALEKVALLEGHLAKAQQQYLKPSNRFEESTSQKDSKPWEINVEVFSLEADKELEKLKQQFEKLSKDHTELRRENKNLMNLLSRLSSRKEIYHNIM